MACPNCNDLQATSQSLDDIAISEVENSAKTCKFCQMVLFIVRETDLTLIDCLRFTKDTQDDSYDGIKLHVRFLPGYIRETGCLEYTVRNISSKYKFLGVLYRWLTYNSKGSTRIMACVLASQAL